MKVNVCMESKIINDLKDAYEHNDIDTCEKKMFHLIIYYNGKIRMGDYYDHTLKHILFDSNFIRNPLGVKYSEDDYKNTSQILLRALNFCKAINNREVDIEGVFQDGYSINDKIFKDILDLAIYTECLYKMNAANTSHMESNEINKNPFVEQLLSIILFYQDQIRLVKQNYLKDLSKDLLTGMEMSVADKPVEHYENVKVSVSDSFESMLESIDEILRYLYYKFGKGLSNTVTETDINTELIRPYENAVFELYFNIAAQRHLLCRLEEGIRNGYYCFSGFSKTDNDTNVYVFTLENDENYRARSLGIFRREYQIRRYSVSDYRNQECLDSAHKQIPLLADKLINNQTEENLLLRLVDFHPETDEFIVAEGISKTKEHICELLTKEYYFKQEVQGVKIFDLVTAYDYLNALAEIVFCASARMINVNDQTSLIKQLCLVDISYLAEELSRIHQFDIGYSTKLINRFVFQEKNNKEDDAFAQPLIKISKTQVVFSHALIDQVNLDRVIERQFLRYNKDVSAIGHIFERDFIQTLKKGYSTSSIDFERKDIPNFAVNENKIEFTAFDGKDIEFDVVAVLGDFLILTELKAVMTSYDLCDLEKRKKNVKNAIKQLHRRANSVKYDWDKIRERLSIELPEKPFDKDHIILVVCTDTYDFTPLKKDDVYITDDSTYLKYFTNPYVEAIELTNASITIHNTKQLWSKGYPCAEEFVEYLLDPVTIHPFVDCINKELAPLPFIDETDLAIVCEEYRLMQDPIKAIILGDQ